MGQHHRPVVGGPGEEAAREDTRTEEERDGHARRVQTQKKPREVLQRDEGIEG